MEELINLIKERLNSIIEEEVKKLLANRVCPNDGIFLVYQDGTYLPFTGMEPKKNVKYVGVVHDGHAFCVALNDLGELPLFPNLDKCPDESPFYKTECEGLHDWDFIASTNHLMEEGCEIPLATGEYIPTLAVLEVMCFHKEKINAALTYVGGSPMPDDYHWSSSEYYRSHGRFVNFSNGFTLNNYKYNSYVVRPVAAFTFEA